MSLKETKFYFESLFTDNWTETPIHYAGQDFDEEGTAKWIGLTYNPLRTINSGLSKAGKKNYGSLSVICWAENDVDVMELVDTAVAFMETNVQQNMYALNGFNVEDHAWHKSNKVYVYLTFNVTSYFC